MIGRAGAAQNPAWSVVQDMRMNESGHDATTEAYVMMADAADNERVIKAMHGMYLGAEQLYVEEKNRTYLSVPYPKKPKTAELNTQTDWASDLDGGKVIIPTRYKQLVSDEAVENTRVESVVAAVENTPAESNGGEKWLWYPSSLPKIGGEFRMKLS